MTIVMWMTSKYGNEIKRVECSRVTEKSAWVLEVPFSIDRKKHDPVERRRDRNSEYDQYHESWEMAHEYLIQRENRSVEYARGSLDRALKDQATVMALKKPEGA